MNARYEQLDLSATDYPLYDGHPPSEHGSDTSMAAATEIEAVGPLLRRAVYAWVCRRGERGATCDEVEVAMGMPHQTASARLRELEMLKELDKTNEKRRTRTGRWARVYRGDGK
jgi:hypothetical protein